MIASRVNANALHIQGRFVGEGCDGFSSLDQTISMPNGYNAQIPFIGNIILVTLSQDSRTIELNNPNYPVCSETGIRTGRAPNNNGLSTVTVSLALMFLLSDLMSFGQLVM
jgi:hypothetical protein